MDIVRQLSASPDAIVCVDMHTTGEPTRIVLAGYPELSGTLLEQRAQAKQSHDHIRRKLMLEPRGHRDMYGAILRSRTEHVDAGRAHIGVLFTTNDGYSTMCGHATTALGRFLIDTHDPDIFPRRDEIQVDPSTKTALLLLHAPCGIVEVTVPTAADGLHSDPTRPISHISVPSFTTGIDVKIDLEDQYQWPHLRDQHHVTADFSYGGAFFCLVSAKELGFPDGLRGKVDVPALDHATQQLKAAVDNHPQLQYLFSHPDHSDLGFLYSVIVVDDAVGQPLAPSSRAETGLCFFADQQVDRSPTGSGVAARVALAHAKGDLALGECKTYHSLLSYAMDGRGGFVGQVRQVIDEQNGFPIIRARIEGYASYIGSSVFAVEQDDILGDDGFLLERLA